MRVRRRMLMLSTSRRKVSAWLAPSSPARAMKARMSLGRQPPPKPSPALRNRRPIRASWPSASASTRTSAPAASHTSEMALMNEILVARKALADDLDQLGGLQVGEQERHALVEQGRVEFAQRRLGADRIASARQAQCDPDAACRAPRSPRAGTRDSTPPRHRHRQAPIALRRRLSSAAVPTGTVDLPKITADLVSRGTRSSMTACTWRRSAPYSPFFCGVPTPRKWTSANSAARLVVGA